MLIDKINEDLRAARILGDAPTRTLLSTLYAEAAMVGKNKRNGPSTDEEVVSVVKKFVANTEETAKILQERGRLGDLAGVRAEQAILSKYLPRQMSAEELAETVRRIVADNGLSGPKAMGAVMAELKARYAGQYDGKQASDACKLILI